MRLWRTALLVAGVVFIAGGSTHDRLWPLILGACLLSTFVFTGED